MEHMDFWKLNKTERVRRLKNYKKFLVVRDPFERLLSAYRNKLKPEREDAFGEMSRKIHHQEAPEGGKEQATFSEFLEYLVDYNQRKIPINEHWETYWKICFPCDINYDYILNLETIEEDSNWIFDKFNISKIKYPKGNKNPSNENLLQNSLKNISVGLQKAVYHYLRTDFELFDYSPPEGILTAG